jgi:hypothetical protein
LDQRGNGVRAKENHSATPCSVYDHRHRNGTVEAVHSYGKQDRGDKSKPEDPECDQHGSSQNEFVSFIGCHLPSMPAEEHRPETDEPEHGKPF